MLPAGGCGLGSRVGKWELTLLAHGVPPSQPLWASIQMSSSQCRGDSGWGWLTTPGRISHAPGVSTADTLRGHGCATPRASGFMSSPACLSREPDSLTLAKFSRLDS